MLLTRRPAADLLADIQAGQLSAQDLMRATLDRIAQANLSCNAIVALRDYEELMAEACAADALPPERRGALHGLPIAVKDLVNVAGILSSQGSPLFADHIPEADDVLAARMRAAGAMLIGKTNTPEFGLGSHTFNPVHGATTNPYGPDHTCGGSSGGAAVALATGMVALADGSDMMGSLRNPAAWNNVYGLRPSWGLLAGEEIGASALQQMSTLGPMARNPRDLALFLDALMRPEQALGPLPAPKTPARIGWLGDWGGAFPMEPGILEICREALTVYEDLGCVVEDVPPPFDADAMWQSWVDLRAWQVGSGLRDFQDRRHLLKDTAQWELDRSLSLSAMRVHDMGLIRAEWFKAASDLFSRYDALVLPSAQVWPFPVDLDWPAEIAGQGMDTYHRWMQVMVPVSLLGLPAVAVPAGFGAAGLPMGMQIFGPRGGDSALLALAQTYHEATDWPGRRPALP